MGGTASDTRTSDGGTGRGAGAERGLRVGLTVGSAAGGAHQRWRAANQRAACAGNGLPWPAAAGPARPVRGAPSLAVAAIPCVCWLAGEQTGSTWRWCWRGAVLVQCPKPRTATPAPHRRLQPPPPLPRALGLKPHTPIPIPAPPPASPPPRALQGRPPTSPAAAPARHRWPSSRRPGATGQSPA